MPLNVLDPSTWQASTLDTPDGPITYWALADWESFYEQYETEGNLTRILLAVNWKDATKFKRYALGYAAKASSQLLFRRVPLLCPYQDGQYLASLKKYAVHAGVDSAGPLWHEAGDVTLDRWPNFTETAGGMEARVVYDATFRTLPYDVVSQDDMNFNGWKELKRYVVREEQTNPKERRTPSAGFEVASGAVGSGKPILEVGFVPYYTIEFTYTWMAVPIHLVPHTAIKNCLLRVNNAAWDYQVPTADTKLTSDTYGRFGIGEVLFVGPATRFRPYRGPNAEWLQDVSYLFQYQPADGGGTTAADRGHNRIPDVDTTTWVAIRNAVTGDPMYGSADFEALFQPGP